VAATPTAGDTVTVIAVEGRRPYELQAIIIGDVQLMSLDPGGAASPPSDAWHRLEGRVESIAGGTLRGQRPRRGQRAFNASGFWILIGLPLAYATTLSKIPSNMCDREPYST